MQRLIIVGAIFLALIGFLGAATSPSRSDHFAGAILIAVAVGFVLLALYAPPKVTAVLFFGSIALVIVAYRLPRSFWVSVGLADRPPSQHSDDHRQ